MAGARWSAVVAALRGLARSWRPLAGLALAMLGLFALPAATTDLMPEPAPPTVRPTGPPGVSTSWIPTTRTPRIADTTIRVERSGPVSG